MGALVSRLLALIPFPVKVGIIAAGGLAILGTVGGIAYKLDQDGYHRAELEWTVKYQKREAELNQQRVDELDRQASINAMAKADEAAALEAYRLKLREMAQLTLQLMEQAAEDPNANKVALDAEAIARHKKRIGK